MTHESPNLWTIILTAVLLGVQSAVKERLGRRNDLRYDAQVAR